MKNKINDESEEKPDSSKEDTIFVTSQDQANQIYEDMKNREISAFNHNYNETEKMLKEARNRLYSTKTHTLKELEDIKALITEYIGVIRTIVSTLPDRTSFKENEKFIARNKEYNNYAIITLETLHAAATDRIKRRENEQLEKLPKTFLTGLTTDQLKNLRKQLIESEFIYNNVSDVEFVYIFSGNPIIKNMKPIKWKLSRGAGALRDFLTLLLPGITIHKNQVEYCFLDEKGKSFTIGKPKKNSRGHYSVYFKKFEKIIDSIKQ